MASRVNWTILGVHQWHECENEPSISCSTTVKSLSERVADNVFTDFIRASVVTEYAVRIFGYSLVIVCNIPQFASSLCKG